MTSRYQHSALAIIAGALAAVLVPPVAIAPSAWAAAELVVPDGPRAGDKFNLELTPYLAEPLDCFADESPVNRVSIRKATQTGFSLAAIAAVGFTIARQPCDLMLVQPTDSALTDFVGEKLSRAIEQSDDLKERVFKQTSRSGRGSTTYTKRYPGGSLLLAIATSTADLRGKTRRKIIKDEAAEYPADLDKQGSPHEMIARRYESFLATADWKELEISTPVIKGACHIDEAFEAGDQRFWHVNCPGCRAKFWFSFSKHFKYRDRYPYEAHYEAPCCGAVIESHEKNALVRSGEWIATAEAPDNHRSYHFDALSSPFVPWDVVAERIVLAGDDPAKLKALYNLTFGLAYEMKGDAPDHVRLMERREPFAENTVPPEGLLLTAGCDVQHSGIWAEVVAWAQDRQSWTLSARFLEGETTDPERGAFARLAALYDEQFPDAFSARRVLDAMAIDAGDGGRANQVYAFCRGRARAFAIKGMPGWTYPAIGQPSRVHINLRGKRVPRGATLWPVGTWALKATWYANLRKEGRAAGHECDPPGYCHFGQDFLGENYFKQITAEYLAETTFRGRSTRVWKESGPNHLLDCRIYNMAMAEHLGLSRLTEEQWTMLRKMRGAPEALKNPDLISPDSTKLAARPPLPMRKPGRRRAVLSPGVV